MRFAQDSEEVAMIYTSYFPKVKELEAHNITPIAICLKIPSWYSGLSFRALAPKPYFFGKWKETHDNDYYVAHYKADVLHGLDANDVVNKLKQLSAGSDIALLCYEKPTDFCHRHLVAEWLNSNGIECREYGTAVTCDREL